MRSLRILAAAAGVLALAACGSSDTQADAPAAATNTTVAVGSSNALTDARGMTLYFTDQDTTGKLACVSDACLQFWKPLTVTGGQTPTGPDQVSDKLGTTKRPEGTMQVTFDGKPLYTFTLDKTSGQVNGNGLTDEFDGTSFTWHSITTEGAAPATTQPNNDDPGYGY
jgi:predicted lipoprotein with Yx(FWY)xxD motif